MPAGTVFAKYEPQYFDNLCIKGDTCGKNDFFYQPLHDSLDASSSSERADILIEAEEDGISIPLDFDAQFRDGLFDDDQLFAVWSDEDVRQLIERLQGAAKRT